VHCDVFAAALKIVIRAIVPVTPPMSVYVILVGPAWIVCWTVAVIITVHVSME